MAEILRQLIVNLTHYWQGLIRPKWLFEISSIHSIIISSKSKSDLKKQMVPSSKLT